jgi:solute carrier family 45 protein 1/2/4
LIAALLALAWTQSIVGMLFATPAFHSGNQLPNPHNDATVTLAIALTFCIYSAVQPVQGGIRALIVDVCPAHQQQNVNAWVTRISGIASILGYLSAVLDLSKYISWFGDTQFKNLSVLASLTLAVTLSLSCIYVPEKTPSRRAIIKSNSEQGHTPDAAWINLAKKFGKVGNDILDMPKQIKRIYLVQFFAWIGWYPYLVYVTT